jgi:succinate dehydrogenase / fumarate reductase cytochrome b subunit
MRWILDCWRSSIGAKATMAVTGLLLFLFVVGHLIGNLQIFAGPEPLNAYAAFLHSPKMATPLLIVRLAMAGIVLLHIATGVRLALNNRAARPVAYHKQTPVESTFASRWMVVSGLALLVFVIYHLLHFTVHVAIPAGALPQDGNVYHMVVASFRQPAIAIAYIAFMVVLFFHLSHGFQSLFQTFGLRHPRYSPLIAKLSLLFAVLLAGGNILIPLSVLLGIVKEAA